MAGLYIGLTNRNPTVVTPVPGTNFGNCSYYVGPAGAGERVEIDCVGYGRYLVVYRSDGWLTICEAEVYIGEL